MDIKIYPGKLHGTVAAPPSKSMAHRGLICGSLAEGESIIKGISGSKDMEATIGAMRALGAEIRLVGDTAYIKGNGGKLRKGSLEHPESAKEPTVLDCIESGSTLRFVLPIAAALGVKAEFNGRGKLPERPMTPLTNAMKEKGIKFYPNDRDTLPLIIEGKLEPGIYKIPGDVSSQYISGLLFALPLLHGDSQIHILGDLESVGYLNLSLDMIAKFGIEIQTLTSDLSCKEEAEGKNHIMGFYIKGNQKYKPNSITVEGDYSNGAFWLAAGAMTSMLTVSGLDESSVQGDKAVVRELESFGISIERDSVGACYPQYDLLISPGKMKGIAIDGRDIPDIIPILSVVATKAQGKTTFKNVSRLRIKESDRLAAMVDCLTRLGIMVQSTEDTLIVEGGTLIGGEVSGYNDHRIVMSMAIAALNCKEPVIIRGYEATEKSYPNFFDEFRRLGGRADVISDR